MMAHQEAIFMASVCRNFINKRCVRYRKASD